MLGYDARRDARRDTDLSDTTAVVIASHGGPEAEIIRAALDNGVGYIGLVASKVRGASILNSLDLSDAERARVHTPVGLAIGAKTPAEIAVSIAAELIAGIRGGSLSRPVSVDGSPREAVDPVCGMTVTIGPATEHLQAGRRGLLVLRPGMPGRRSPPGKTAHDRRGGSPVSCWRPAAPAAWARPNSFCHTGIRPCSGRPSTSLAAPGSTS